MLKTIAVLAARVATLPLPTARMDVSVDDRETETPLRCFNNLRALGKVAGTMRSGALWLTTGLLLSSATTAGTETVVPDFSGFWLHGAYGQQYRNPPSGPGPIQRIGVPEDASFTRNWFGDDQNPILQPWAAEVVRGERDRELQGLPDSSGFTTCRPMGVPFILSYVRPVQFLQTPDRVHIIYQYDHQSRVVYLNQPHSKDLKPSYYGESVGHYEGNTLVVDTIGMNDKTWTDRFGTPHTDQLHVVERYSLINGGERLSVLFTVSDPGAFTTKWSAIVRFKRAEDAETLQLAPSGTMLEEVCAENNYGPIPIADKPDF